MAAAAPDRATPPKGADSNTGPSPPVSTGSGRSLRSSSQKPQTPRTTRSAHMANGNGSSQRSQRSPSKPAASPTMPLSQQTPQQQQQPKKRKPVFVSCTNFPQFGPAPPPVVKEEAELQRSARKSKQDAISKLDRVGTPTLQVATSAGPAATSFVPPPPPLPAGPSVLRNPLKRPHIENPPFDLGSVRTVAPTDPGPSTQPRLFDLPTCPTYYPTAEQFVDPMAYIDSIGPEAKKYGICKIVPPEGWHMPFTVETDKFRFTTRLQRLNSIEAASRAKINFLEQLSMFHKQQGDATAYIPRIEHKLLDLWRLRKEVNQLGGIDEVNRLKAWPKVTQGLGYNPNASPQVRAAYTKIVLPFENWALRAKSYPESPGTPAPGSAVKSKPTTAANSPDTPTAASGRMSGVRTSPRSRMGAVKPESQLTAMSFGPDGGRASAAGNEALAPPAKIRIKVPGFQTSSHGSDSELSEEESSRASSSAAGSPEQPGKYEKGDVCEICGLGNHAPKILLCDGCDRGFHTYCLDPPLSGIPANEWYCTACLLGNGDDYGFDEGEEHSLPSFQARDAAFTEEWFTRYCPTNAPAGPLTRQMGTASISEADVEREFWRLVESQDDTVEVEYGADVHSTTHGSAAPTLETHPTNKYSSDPWNLNNMPILKDSLLRYIKSDISGMTVPWIYVGMLFSAFCWHNEDHYTYSVNYMFWGETKTWYGIPGSQAEKFEAAIRSEAPELFERQPSLLYQLVTMMNPGRLRDLGVDTYACDQRPNEFVITFPKAYHCGFNHGLNFNEAVNFALPDWLPEGRESVMRYREHAKPPVFSHNELLITITLYSDTIKTALWLQDSLRQMVEDESAGRNRLREAIPDLEEVLHEEDVPEAQYQCCVCKGFCYLSQVTCSCTDLVTCFDHADLLCECEPAKRTLRKRFSENQLQDILDAVVTRAAQPEAWEGRLDALLSVPRPQLKTIRQLVSDGERIPHALPGLSDLRAFVDRANAWIERAASMTTRKSTGRRRKGRQSEVVVEEDDVDRSPQAFRALLAEAEKLAFDAPEIGQLRAALESMDQFARDAADILAKPDDELDFETCQTALILGESLHVTLPEIAALRTVVSRLQWYRKIDEEVDDRALQYSDIVHLLEEAREFGVADDDSAVVELRRRERKGREWKEDVDRLLAAPSISLDDISSLMEGQEFTPTSIETMRHLENIRKTAQGWQTSAANLLRSRGSAAAAQRLCKAVRTASGPLKRIKLPEVSDLQAELDFNAKWMSEVANVLRVPATKVHTSLTNLLRDIEEHLEPDDARPNDEHSCFCRARPAANMITCPSCEGTYHPRCVGITAKTASGIKAASETFQCQMCLNLQYDDRPSFHELAQYVDLVRWNFVLRPPEFDLIDAALQRSVRYAVLVIQMMDTPPSPKDAAQAGHLLRKIWTLPVQIDAFDEARQVRVVFEDWLYNRLREATGTATTKSTGGGGGGRTRARKPRFDFEAAEPHHFHCVCTHEPLDHLLTVQCSKCEQRFHLSCIHAPITQANAEGRGGWRCPFCVVKSGKPASRGLDLRVQMADKVGTDEYVDWRQSLYVYSDVPITCTLPPNCDALVLVASAYHGPALPDGFERPVWTGDEDGRRKRRKTDPAAPAPGHSASPSTASSRPAQDAWAAQAQQQTPQPTPSPYTARVAHPSAHLSPVAPSPVAAPGIPNGHAAPMAHSANAALQNEPAQNRRAGGRLYYPTHSIVPWEDQNMFSQFQVGAGGPGGSPGARSRAMNGTVPAPAHASPIAHPSCRPIPTTAVPAGTAPLPTAALPTAPLPPLPPLSNIVPAKRDYEDDLREYPRPLAGADGHSPPLKRRAYEAPVAAPPLATAPMRTHEDGYPAPVNARYAATARPAQLPLAPPGNRDGRAD